MTTKSGHFGRFGGTYVPETLIPALKELNEFWHNLRQESSFWDELGQLLQDYVGRPTPLYFAKNLSKKLGKARIYLKREDLCHTGAHKINNALGQGLLARKLGKKRLIAETGAGQHGVAVATVASLLGLECEIFMGAQDMKRQAPNVERMKILGAKVVSVELGSQTLKDAMNEALRNWVSTLRTTHYLIGSVAGPHPYPSMVRDFQAIIGMEVRQQILQKEGSLPQYLVACIGGGSNAMGLFAEFLKEPSVALIGVEAAGEGLETERHAASLTQGSEGVLHGSRSLLLQDEHGQVKSTHSISAGLDYPGVGPQLADLKDRGVLRVASVTDEEAIQGFELLAQTEGIIPALESSHALGFLMEFTQELKTEDVLVVNLSGRGDKDLSTYLQWVKK